MSTVEDSAASSWDEDWEELVREAKANNTFNPPVVEERNMNPTLSSRLKTVDPFSISEQQFSLILKDDVTMPNSELGNGTVLDDKRLSPPKEIDVLPKISIVLRPPEGKQDIKKFLCPNFQHFQEKVRTLSASFYYVDEDGDKVTLADQDDWETMVASPKEKFVVYRVNTPSLAPAPGTLQRPAPAPSPVLLHRYKHSILRGLPVTTVPAGCAFDPLCCRPLELLRKMFDELTLGLHWLTFGVILTQRTLVFSNTQYYPVDDREDAERVYGFVKPSETRTSFCFTVDRENFTAITKNALTGWENPIFLKGSRDVSRWHLHAGTWDFDKLLQNLEAPKPSTRGRKFFYSDATRQAADQLFSIRNAVFHNSWIGIENVHGNVLEVIYRVHKLMVDCLPDDLSTLDKHIVPKGLVDAIANHRKQIISIAKAARALAVAGKMPSDTSRNIILAKLSYLFHHADDPETLAFIKLHVSTRFKLPNHLTTSPPTTEQRFRLPGITSVQRHKLKNGHLEPIEFSVDPLGVTHMDLIHRCFYSLAVLLNRHLEHEDSDFLHLMKSGSLGSLPLYKRAQLSDEPGLVVMRYDLSSLLDIAAQITTDAKLRSRITTLKSFRHIIAHQFYMSSPENLTQDTLKKLFEDVLTVATAIVPPDGEDESLREILYLYQRVEDYFQYRMRFRPDLELTADVRPLLASLYSDVEKRDADAIKLISTPLALLDPIV